MSKDPDRCCGRTKDGARCEAKPMYKIGHRGFCAEHKPGPQETRRLLGTATTVPEDERNGGNFYGQLGE